MWATASGMPSGAERRQRESPEGALVDEAQLRAAVGEVEDGVAVLLERRVGRLDEHLAAHAEVDDEGVLAVEDEPEVLAPARRRGDRRSVSRAARSSGAGVVAACHAHAADPGARRCGARRRGPRRPRRTTSTSGSSGISRGRDDRTGCSCVSLARWRTGARRGRARPPWRPSAPLPSCCGPCPSPSTSSPKTTRAWNSFSWSGPCSSTRYSGEPEADRSRPSPAGSSSSRAPHPSVAASSMSAVEVVVHELRRALDVRRTRKTVPMSASIVSARIEALSRPPVASSPLPSMTYSPRSNVRATSASARMLTTAARSLASWPSARSGCSR